MKELNEFLAVGVMGWHKQPKPLPYWWLNELDEGVFLIKDWNPAENIEQAMMCLDVFQTDITHITIDPEGDFPEFKYIVEIGNGNIGSSESLPLAISLSCARAKWEKDE